MSRWWRAYEDAVDHPKLLLLSDKSHRAWFNLLCLASANGGELPSMEIICLKLRLKKKVVDDILDELIERALIDQHETSLRPHDWNGRQFKSDVSTERVKQFRERERNVSVTPPETEEQITETDSEKKAFRPKRVRTVYAEDFENFWKAYPRTPLMSKSEAFKIWEKLSAEDRLSAAASLPKYKAFLASKPDHKIVHACRFLSQRRFDGLTEIVETEPTGPPKPPDPSMPSDEELRKKYQRTSHAGANGTSKENQKIPDGSSGLHEKNQGDGPEHNVPHH